MRDAFQQSFDLICHELEEHGHDNAHELITATRIAVERESGVGRILLHVVADSEVPDAFDLFAERFESTDAIVRPYGVAVPTQLDTEAARRLHWPYSAVHDGAIQQT
jgi:hypothetical protein